MGKKKVDKANYYIGREPKKVNDPSCIIVVIHRTEIRGKITLLIYMPSANVQSLTQFPTLRTPPVPPPPAFPSPSVVS